MFHGQRSRVDVVWWMVYHVERAAADGGWWTLKTNQQLMLIPARITVHLALEG